MTRRQLLLTGALVLAAGLAFFADKTPDSTLAEAVVRAAAPGGPAPAVATAALTSAPRAASRVGTSASADLGILVLHPRADLIGDAEEARFGASVFLSQNWTPAPPKAAPAPAPPPPPPPAAPPLPFTYLGKAAGDGAWEVFLARAEQTYVVRKGMLIDAAYRVENIAPPVITLTYLPLNQVQQLNIGVPD